MTSGLPPSGTVTFLFSDIEGSVLLAQEHPEHFGGLLARHNAILREAIALRRGYIFGTAGDSFCAAFAAASDAVGAAVSAQRQLQAEPWGPASMKVRMGIHTGEAWARAGQEEGVDYDGYLTLTRTQRIMAAAHGGQVLISGTTAEILRGHLPEQVLLRDMAEHRLKGVTGPEHLWQLVAPGLAHDFPSLLTASRTPHNLPAQLTSFIGRGREIGEIKDLLASAPMVTLVGVGGTGKTRVALEVAGQVMDQFADGAWLIQLAPLRDPALVPHAVAAGLGLNALAGHSPLVSLVDHLGQRQMLLVLDNCEHLAAACADLASALLPKAPKLQILATSRAPLNVAGEFLYSVPPLSVPASDRDLPLAALMQSEAVLLFLARAQAARPSFRLTNENAAGVLQVCQHLDGIPLALELAAARVRLLSPEQIAARLGDRFSLLTGGDRSPLTHHQTLRGALDWSYDLLTGPERQLLRRLAVFAGSFSLDAVEEICAERSEDGQAEQALHRSQVRESHVLDLLAALVDHSLIILEERETENRYRLLETVRQYALDKLRASGEQATFQDRHLEFYVALAQEGAPHIDAGRPAWTARFESDYDNFREAMAVALDGHPASALLLGVSLAGFARFSRRLYETDGWATRILALTTAEPGANAPASALWLAGDLRLWMGDYSQAEGLLNSSLNRARWLGDKQQMGRTLNDLGQMHLQRGQRVELARCVGEYNTFAEELGNPVWTIDALRALGIFDIDEGDENAGQARFEEALALARKHDLPRLKAEVLWAIGQLAHLRGDLGRAEQLYGESALTLRRIGYLRSLRSVVADLGKLELERGHDVEARTLFEENSALTLELRDLPEYNVVLLMGLAGTAGLAGQDERAARLFAAADSVLKRRDWDLNAVSHRVYDPIIAAVHARLGNEAFDAAWTEGSRMTVDQALEYARAEAPAGRQP